MAPIAFKRSKAERRPRRIITKDLFKPYDEDELSPLEMEKKFVVCKSPEGTTPETVDSIVMTFSDDSFDENDCEDDDQFGDACQFDVKWWEEEPTPAKNNTTTSKLKDAMTPFSKLALESTSKRLALSPLDTNNKIQLDIKPILMSKKDNSWRRNNQDSKRSASNSPFLFSKHKSAFSQAIEDKNNDDDDDNAKSPAEIKKDLDAFWKSTKAARQPYISPFSKHTLARNAEGKHSVPPTYSASKDQSQWVQFTPVKGFSRNTEKSLTTPFSKRKNRRGSPMLSPLDSSAFLTPAKQETPEPKNLFELSLEEGQDVVEIKIRKKSEEDNADCSVVSGLTKIVEVDDEPNEQLAMDPKDLDAHAIDTLTSYPIWGAKEVGDGAGIDSLTSSCDIWGVVVKEVEEDLFDAGDGLLSNFLHNFMVSTPPKKR